MYDSERTIIIPIVENKRAKILVQLPAKPWLAEPPCVPLCVTLRPNASNLVMIL